jgi:hypothetical protein
MKPSHDCTYASNESFCSCQIANVCIRYEHLAATDFAHTLECMKNYVSVSFTATALTASAVALAAVANAAPTGPSSVDQTVRTLEASGYNIIVNRTGAAPLSQCIVSAVRPGADAFHRRFAWWQLDQYDDHLEDGLRRRGVLSAHPDDRQPYSESCFPVGRFSLDVAVVRLDNRGGDGQPEAEAVGLPRP